DAASSGVPLIPRLPPAPQPGRGGRPPPPSHPLSFRLWCDLRNAPLPAGQDDAGEDRRGAEAEGRVEALSEEDPAGEGAGDRDEVRIDGGPDVAHLVDRAIPEDVGEHQREERREGGRGP